MITIKAARQRRGASIFIGLRLTRQLYVPMEKAWRHKVKKYRLNPKSYGFSSFLRDMAHEGLKLYFQAHEDDF